MGRITELNNAISANDGLKAVAIINQLSEVQLSVLNKKVDLINRAAYLGNQPIVEALLKKNIDVNYKGSDDYTPLLRAAQGGHMKLVKYLVEKGGDIKYTNINTHNENIIHWVAYWGDLKFLEELYAKGFNIDQANNNNVTPLAKAASKGHFEIVKFLYEKGAKIDIADHQGNTLMIMACEASSFQIVKFLHEKGADINVVAKNGYTALLLASRCLGSIDESRDIINYLVKNGADINVKAENAYTVITHLAGMGELETIKLLHKKGVDIHCLASDHTPIMEASLMGHTAVVEFLHKTGVDINFTTKSGYTPLMHASLRSDNLEVIQFLLDNGANVNAKALDGSTALMGAAQYGHLSIIELLLKNGASVKDLDNNKYSALSKAAQNGHTQVVEYLVKKGVNIDQKTEDGYTPICLAMQNGHLETVKLLYENDADIHYKTTSGISLVAMAYAAGHAEIGEFLWEKGAKNIYEVINGWTPLSSAAQNGKFKSVKLLLEKGVNLHTENQYNQSALHLAVEGNHLDTVELLLKNGAKVDSRDHFKTSIINVAADSGHTKILKKLLINGANINDIDAHKNTNLMLAIMNNRLETVKFLLEKGADIYHKNNREKTALDVAEERKHLDCINLLKSADAINKIISNQGLVNIESVIFDDYTLDLCKNIILRQMAEKDLDPLSINLEQYKQVLPNDFFQELCNIILNQMAEKKLNPLSINLEKYKKVLPDDVFQELNNIIKYIKLPDSNIEVNQDLIADVSEKLAEGNERISGKEKNGILLLGNTGFGKTTLAHLLMKKPLKSVLNEYGDYVIEAIEPTEGAKISHDNLSETKIPNKFNLSNDTAIWDCPGFNDIDPAQELVNSFYIKKLYQQHDNLKFVCVVSEGSITSAKSKDFVQMLEQISSNFRDVDAIGDSLCLVITGANPGKTSIHFEKKLETIFNQPSLSPKAKQLLGHLRSNILLFHAPKDEGIILLDDISLVDEINESVTYTKANSDLAKFKLSDKAQEYAAELVKLSFNYLQSMCTILFNQSQEFISINNNNNNNANIEEHVGADNWHHNVKKLLPKILPKNPNGELGVQIKGHSSSEYFLRLNQFIKLSNAISNVIENNAINININNNNYNNNNYNINNNNNDNNNNNYNINIIGNANISSDKLFNLIEEIFNIFEEYEQNEEVRTTFFNYAYVTNQISNYYKLFKDLISNKNLLSEDFNEAKINKYILDLLIKLKFIVKNGLEQEVSVIKIENHTDEAYYKNALAILEYHPSPVEKVKKQALCYEGIGKSNLLAEKSIIAEVNYLKAISLDKTLIDSYEGLAEIYYNESKNEQNPLFYQKQVLEQAVKIYSITKNTVKLKECFKKLIENDPSNPEIYELYADILFKLSLYQKAQQYYYNAKSLLSKASENYKNKSDEITHKINDCGNLDLLKLKHEKNHQDIENNIFYNFDDVSELSPLLTGNCIENYGDTDKGEL